MLPPCDAPNLDPFIVTWLPRTPDAGETPGHDGGRRTIKLTVALLAPAIVTTVTAPETAVAGTVRWICVSDQEKI